MAEVEKHLLYKYEGISTENLIGKKDEQISPGELLVYFRNRNFEEVILLHYKGNFKG